MAMIPGIIGVVGASAVTEIRRRTARHNEVKVLKEELNNARKQLEEQEEFTSEVASKCSMLEQVNQALEDRNKDLEVKTDNLQRDLETSTVSVVQMQENFQDMSATCTQLKKKTGRLLEQHKKLQNSLHAKEQEVTAFSSKVTEQERLIQELAAEKQQLLEALETERKCRASERQTLITEKEQLLLKMEQSEEERQQEKQAAEEERRKMAAEMDKLKSSVAKIMDKFFSDDLNEKDVVAQLNGLGCEVKLIEDNNGTSRVHVVDSKQQLGRQSSSGIDDWVFQPRLVLDCPDRMQRLVAASMAQQQSRPTLRASATMPPMRALQPTDLNRMPSRPEPATTLKPLGKLGDGSEDLPAPAPAPAPTPALKPSFNIQVTNNHHDVQQQQPTVSTRPQVEAEETTFHSLLRRATSGLSFKHTSPPSDRPALAPSVSSHTGLSIDHAPELTNSTDIIKASDK